jgi:hypothetical protein
MKQLTDVNSSIVNLRTNSIKVDQKLNTTTTKNSTKSMKANRCFVRVDIYNRLL